MIEKWSLDRKDLLIEIEEHNVRKWEAETCYGHDYTMLDKIVMQGAATVLSTPIPLPSYTELWSMQHYHASIHGGQSHLLTISLRPRQIHPSSSLA
jgi:hypothetical protein